VIDVARIAYPDRQEIPESLAQLLAVIRPRVAAIDMLAHSPQIAEQVIRKAQQQFTALELSDRARELVILTVAARGQCDFEYQQHIPISVAAGVDPELRESIWGRDVDLTALPEKDRVLLEFTDAVLDSPRVSNHRFAALQRCYSLREIVEIIDLVGFYWGFGRVCTVLEVEVDSPTGLDAFQAVANLAQDV
jgi:alkylhydroperoxidase family enzyme